MRYENTLCNVTLCLAPAVLHDPHDARERASIKMDLDRRIKELSSDAFYNEYNQALLREAIHDMKAGKGVPHELIDCE